MPLSLYLQKKNENKRKSSFLVLPLFINYLMKSGKKTRSLHLLEKSIHLFSHLLLKKKLPYITKSFLAFLPFSLLKKNYNYIFFQKKYNEISKRKVYNKLFLEKNSSFTNQKKNYKTIYNFFYKEKYKKNLYLYFFPEPLKQRKTEKFYRISFFLEKLKKKKFYSKKDSIKNQNEKLCFWYKLYKKNLFSDCYTFAQKNTFLFYFYKAIENVKPPLECRSKRFGGTNRQIPATVSEHRQWGFAIRWIIEAAEILKNSKKKKEYTKKSKEGLSTGQKPSFSKKGQKLESFGIKKTEKEKNFNDYSTTGLTGPTIQNEVLKGVKDKVRNHDWSRIRFTLSKTKTKELKNKKEKTSLKNSLFCFFLAEALYQAYYNRGSAIEKRNLWIDSAISNRAFLRYRWW